jgi:octaprenyl-diphosphate synthase
MLAEVEPRKDGGMKLLAKLDEGLKPTVERLLEDFELRMAEELEELTPPPFIDAVAYAIHGGKRVRPLILLLASRAVEEPSVDPFPAAVAVELLHCESLIHDDAIDRERTRRGMEPFYLRFGPELTLLSADLMLGLSMKLVARYRRARLMRAMAEELSRSVLEMCEGELLESLLLRMGRRGLRSYLRVVKLKTAPLFRSSAKLGGLISTGGHGGPEVEALAKYGLLLGMAYQVVDDIVDAEREGEAALKLLTARNAARLTQLSRSLMEEAKEALKPLKPSPFREALSQLADVDAWLSTP